MFRFFVEVDYLFQSRHFDYSVEVLSDSAESALDAVKRHMLISPVTIISETVECI